MNPLHPARVGAAVRTKLAAQGVEFRSPLTTSPELRRVIATLRAHVATLEEDRYMAPDLEAAGGLVADGTLVSAVSAGLLPGLAVRAGLRRPASFSIAHQR